MDNIVADYALLSLAAYRDKRVFPVNRVYPSVDWQALPNGLDHAADGSGFEAVAYRNTQTNEIVIAYTGTDEMSDWWTNIGGFTGAWPSGQMKSAARFYAEVSAANPAAYITFTGHSLGGGLAGLVGVLFNRPAYTFDPAPFRASANNDIRNAIRDDLDSNSLLSTALATVLDSFHSSLPASGSSASTEPGIRGEDAIRRMVTQNEALAKWLPDNFIGTRAPAILDHASLDQSSVDLHSMSLEAAMVVAPGFWDAAKQLENLIPVIFDAQIFAKDASRSEPTLLDHLLRNQVGVTGPSLGDTTDLAKQKMLDHFAADLAKLVTAGGQAVSDNDLDRALIAFLGRAYLKQDRGFEKELFKAVDGGLNFDTSDVTSDISTDSGFVRHFKTYLETQLGAELFGQYQALITQAKDWYIAGTAMSATADAKAAFMLGGNGTDDLTGGSQADLLVGGIGMDTLNGKAGADILIGGQGSDLYVFNTGDGADTLIDDGANRLIYDGELIAGLVVKDASTGQYKFVDSTGKTIEFHSPGVLTLGGGDTITFQNQTTGQALDGSFGLQLYEETAAPITTRTLTGDYQAFDFNATKDGIQTQTDDLGNVIRDSTKPAPGRYDYFEDSAGNDIIQGFGGDDFLNSWRGGDDRIDGGEGNDWLTGSAGNDLVEGGFGRDVLVEGEGNDRLYADGKLDLEDALALENEIPSGAQGEVLSGGAGDDLAIGGIGNDVFLGGTGDDILVAGAGDDTIDGDAMATNITPAWNVIRSVTT
ncbi:MAG: hypothetical protein U1A72_24760, partial [Sulfuritalea sp.]|nr:hypothetical protein [Sulfuritalea sp.]